MSELKELSWEVQETVQPPPFEALQRRGVRRRRRRQALAGAGAAAVVAIAVLAVALPLGNSAGTETPPPAGRTAIPVDQAAEKLVHDPKSGCMGIVFATPTRWASVWNSPQPGYYNQAAVLHRDGVRTTTPVRKNGYSVLKVGDEVLALSIVPSMKGSDPSWSQAVMIGLTEQGRVEKRLRWAPPTREFADSEVLFESGTLRALNPETGTLREVKIPEVDNATQPYRDSTGRWWVVGAKNSGVGKIFWTDDRGKTWNNSVISPGRMGGQLAVSPDGRTLVVIPPGPLGAAGTAEDDVPLRLSTDRGEHWTTVATRSSTYLQSPVAFDDGTGLALYQGKKRELLRPGAGPPLTPPADLGGLTGTDELVYGLQYNGNNAITSTDRGKTWKYFEPR
jgi:hypothetical protein